MNTNLVSLEKLSIDYSILYIQFWIFNIYIYVSCNDKYDSCLMEQCTIHRFINIYLINLNEQMIPLSFFPKNYATSRINRKKIVESCSNGKFQGKLFEDNLLGRRISLRWSTTIFNQEWGNKGIEERPFIHFALHNRRGGNGTPSAHISRTKSVSDGGALAASESSRLVVTQYLELKQPQLHKLRRCRASASGRRETVWNYHCWQSADKSLTRWNRRVINNKGGRKSGLLDYVFLNIARGFIFFCSNFCWRRKKKKKNLSSYESMKNWSFDENCGNYSR